MSPLSRELAKIIADGQSVTRRLKTILPKVMAAELSDIGQQNQRILKQPCICGDPLFKHRDGKKCGRKGCNCLSFFAIGEKALDRAFPLDV